MENSVYQKDLSCKMFHFLCDVVGSEKMVKNRRLFYQIVDNVQSNSLVTTIVSGSKAEGLNINGSDIDIMMVPHSIPVYNCQSQIENVFGLITDTENAAPGFVLLKLPHGNIPDPKYKYTYSEYGLLLSSDEFKQYLLNLMNNRMIVPSFRIHGPCVSAPDNTVDNAMCLKSETWPIVCMKWFHRPVYSKWPSLNDVAKIKREGLLYVPIGSKFGSKNENHLEWRISFSVAEKILIHSFNHTQLMCYALLKIVLKEVINTNSHITNLLCSYFIKTVVFWLAEESDPSSWNPETLFICFQSCLDRLIYWVRIGYCPNYFMPENNMFEGKIVGKSQRNLLDFLTILRKEGVKLINRSSTLSMFQSHDLLYNVNDSEAEDRAIYPVLFGSLLKGASIKSNYQILRKIKGNLLNGGNLTKSLYLLWMMKNYIQIVENMPYKFHALNKHLYRSYKLVLSHCLIGKNINVVSGGFLLAMFFYRHKEYKKCLSVMNYALQECTPDKYYVQDGLSSNCEEICTNNNNISFLQRHKLSCIHSCFIQAAPQSVLSIQDLESHQISVSCNFIHGAPNVLIHFLRFMCFHHLGNFVERNRCLVDIKLTIEEEFLTYNWQSRLFGLFYWKKAAQVANCWDGYFKEFFKSTKQHEEVLNLFLHDR